MGDKNVNQPMKLIGPRKTELQKYTTDDFRLRQSGFIAMR